MLIWRVLGEYWESSGRVLGEYWGSIGRVRGVRGICMWNACVGMKVDQMCGIVEAQYS